MSERMSYSSMKKLLKCEYAWWFGYIRKLVKRQWKIEFEVGDAFQLGVYHLMDKMPLEEVLVIVNKFIDKRLKLLRGDFSMSTKDEQTFIEMKIIIEGMLAGYAKRYHRDFGVERHVGNEVESLVRVSKESKILIKLDNILEVNKKWYIHEGKAWRSLNEYVVENTKNSFQTATYFHGHNMNMENGIDEIVVGNDRKGNPIKIKPKLFSGIIFDVVMKPSIRIKKGETYRGYLGRLKTYYQGSDASTKFFKEMKKEPMIDRKSWIQTVNECSFRMGEIRDGRDPVKSYQDCNWCDFYEPCYHGEKREIMGMYKEKEGR